MEDTPIHNAPNFEMPASDVRHISLCPVGPVDEMLMNFMDNTDDEAQNMFTAGQKARMKAVLSSEGPRAGLAEAATLCGAHGLIGNNSGNKNRKLSAEMASTSSNFFQTRQGVQSRSKSKAMPLRQQ